MPNAKKEILIVDDDAAMRTTLSHILAKDGYHARSADDGSSALAEIEAGLPDLIVSDLFMPGMSGFEFLSIVGDRFPEIQVIAMSSAFSGDRVPPGVVADAFYEKGTDVRSLLRRVEAMVPSGAVLSLTPADKFGTPPKACLIA